MENDLYVEIDSLDGLWSEELPDGLAAGCCWTSAGTFTSLGTFGSCAGTASSGSTASCAC